MPRARTIFTAGNAGVLSPLLASRLDTDQYYAGLSTGDNIVPIPEGGLRRRPGTLYVMTLTGKARLVRFRFNQAEQYLLVWLDQLLWILKAGVKLTQVVTPYALADLGTITWDQSSDVLALYHNSYDPRQLRRASLATNPIRTTSGSGTVIVEHSAHQLADNDSVGLSDLVGDAGGKINAIPVTKLNTSHTVDVVDYDATAVGADPFTTSTTPGEERWVAVRLPSGHPFADNDRLEIKNSSDVNGIPASEMNNTHTLTSVGATSAKVQVETNATSAGTGGGSAVTYKSPDLYRVTISGETADATGSGGGSGALGWAITKQPLENVPQFDFADELSPRPANEKQRIHFDNTWNDGDKYWIALGGRHFGPLRYSTTTATNASRLEAGFRGLPNTSTDGITVEYDSASGGPGGGDEYVVTFAGDDGNKDWPDIGEHKSDSKTGTLSFSTDVEGGSTEEDVWSATRGWPRVGLFEQSRQWMAGSTSRPTAWWASKSVERYFDFDEGDQFDAEAIAEKLDGAHDRILHMIASDRIWLFTEGGLAFIAGADDEGITPKNAFWRRQPGPGAADVRPVDLRGMILYVDRRQRAVRELSYSGDRRGYWSRDISRFSPHLINAPVEMELLRYRDNDTTCDYVFVVNGDGTAAILLTESDQEIAAWTAWSTDGKVQRVCEVDDDLYVQVERTINGSTVYYLEKTFEDVADYSDDNVFLDSALRLSGSSQTVWNGLDHLEGETVHVIADGVYKGSYTVSGGSITIGTAADSIVVGLNYTTEIVPMPVNVDAAGGPTLNENICVSEVLLDLFEAGDVHVNGFRVRQRAFGSRALVNPADLVTGLVRMGVGGWDRRPDVKITQKLPLPMTVRSITREVVFP